MLNKPTTCMTCWHPITVHTCDKCGQNNTPRQMDAYEKIAIAASEALEMRLAEIYAPVRAMEASILRDLKCARVL